MGCRKGMYKRFLPLRASKVVPTVHCLEALLILNVFFYSTHSMSSTTSRHSNTILEYLDGDANDRVVNLRILSKGRVKLDLEFPTTEIPQGWRIRINLEHESGLAFSAGQPCCCQNLRPCCSASPGWTLRHILSCTELM